jgi:hypothetical protein
VFDPGLGHVRAGFFFSRYGFTATIMDCREFPRDQETSLKAARKQTARENPAPDGRTYSPG